MAIRTTDELVKEVLAPGEDYDLENNPSLTPFIAIANALVDKVAACATRKTDTQTDSTLTLMETWLAAHYYVQSDQNYTSESTGGASGSYQGSTADKGIRGSKYGQSALEIDFSGCLDAITAKRKASAMWGGKPPSSQIPYEQRD